MYAELNQKTKICNTCNEEKEISLFQKDKFRKDGKSNRCKKCTRIRRTRPEVRNYDLAYNKMYAKKNAEHVRKRSRKRNVFKKHGITQEQYLFFLTLQNERCAICLIHVSEDLYPHLSVDHDHKTGEIRGLLCNNCNRGIGLLKDNVEVLLNAAKYLKKIQN